MKLAALPLLLAATLASAQTITFTESTANTCQIATTVCNGLPLDQGGTWQFVLENNVFSITSGNWKIQGAPGSGTGGLQVTLNTVTKSGAVGEIDFTWTATDQTTLAVYTGAAKVQAHYVTICSRHCWPTLRVDSAAIVVH